MRSYKFRAECRGDVFRVLDQINSLELIRLELDSHPLGLPDVTVTLTVRALSLPDLKTRMAKAPDSHVMLETVALPNEYTGERTYS